MIIHPSGVKGNKSVEKTVKVSFLYDFSFLFLLGSMDQLTALGGEGPRGRTHTVRCAACAVRAVKCHCSYFSL
jgi:hypothetical protein